MTTLGFAASVDDWVKQSQGRMEAVFKTATSYVIEAAIDGTPVDTGFLRSSIIVTTDDFLPIRRNAKAPKGTPKKGDANYTGPTFEAQPYQLTINGAELGDTIFASYTANYAGYVEFGSNGRAGVGMVRLAAQNWQQFVDRATREAKAAVNGS